MNRTHHYYPEGLEWTVYGDKCSVNDINRMCRNILAGGTVRNVHRHISRSHYPDGTQEVRHSGTKALTVDSDHVPGLAYVIHLHGYRVVEILEIMTCDAHLKSPYFYLCRSGLRSFLLRFR
jgi:hypothetical protein